MTAARRPTAPTALPVRDELDPALAAVFATPLPDLETGDEFPSNSLLLNAFLRPHLHGLHPYLLEADLHGAVDVSAALPEGARILRHHRRPPRADVLATIDGCLVLLRTWRAAADIWVSGTDDAALDRIVATVRTAVQKPTDASTLRVTFWHRAHHVDSRTRDLELPSWADVRHLYPTSTRTAMDALVTHRSDPASGRLIVWHGPPGTGKTTAVRALLDAWREWASPHVVSDPEALLNDPRYLNKLLLDSDEDDDENGRPWRLVVVEDAEELLRRDARARVGPALGRLLNTADGLLGQGSKAIMLLTTNEQVRDMHPALLRPGRCLARMEFPAFAPAEAAVLLGSPVSEPMTLAEVMERRGAIERLHAAATESPRVGEYL